MITAFDSTNKPVHLTSPLASTFHVVGPTLTARQTFITLQEAAHFEKMINDIFQAGRQKAFADLRELIEVQ